MNVNVEGATDGKNEGTPPSTMVSSIAGDHLTRLEVSCRVDPISEMYASDIIEDSPTVTQASLDRLSEPLEPVQPGKHFLGVFLLTFQPVLLSAVALPATVYVIRGLGPTEYGQLATATALISTITFVANLGLRGHFVRSVAQNPDAAGELTAIQLGTRIALALLGGGIALLVCWLLGYSSIILQCTLVGALGLVHSCVLTTCIDLLQALQRLVASAVTNALSGLILTAASVVAVLYQGGPLAVAISYLVGPLIATIAALSFIHCQHVRVRINWSLGKSWTTLKESRFLAGLQLVNSVAGNGESLFVPRLLGDTIFGIFSGCVLLSSRLASVPDGLATAFYPLIARCCRRQPELVARQITQSLTLMAVVCLPLPILTFFIARPIAHIVFPGDVAVCTGVIYITSWALPLMGLEYLFGYALTAGRKDKSLAGLSLICGGGSLAVTIFLVYWLGIYGAAWSFTLRPVIRAGALTPLFIRTYSPQFTQIPLVRIAVSVICMALILGIISTANSPFHITVAAPASVSSYCFEIFAYSLLGIIVYPSVLFTLRVLNLGDFLRLFRRGSR